MRPNRSIQVEGGFGILKEDYRFRRFLTRDKIHISVEIQLLAFSYNIKKLHNKIQNNQLGRQLHPLKTA